MTNRLKSYFPMLRTREEILQMIGNSEKLQVTFDGWEEEQQTEFLDFCSGSIGSKVLYDFLFKEIFNPEIVPERLESLLTCILGQRVKILRVLPNDTVRLADEGSLLLTDIVVELADGSIVNVEIQKIGYAFPGQRSACYSADLLLRQYKRVRSQRKKKFSYKDIKSVYTIVLFEKSPKEFQQFPKTYIHRFTQQSDSGLQLELLQRYLFVSLDIFKEVFTGREIRSKLEAWLTFLGMDEPADIMTLIKKYPEFKLLYEHMYDICRNVEDVMGLFSKELLELDRNTVRYMMDEMQEELNQKREELNQKKEELNQKKEELNQKKEELNQQREELNQKKEELNQIKEERKRIIEENEKLYVERNKELENKDRELENKNRELENKNRELENKDIELKDKEREIIMLRRKLEEKTVQ